MCVAPPQGGVTLTPGPHFAERETKAHRHLAKLPNPKSVRRLSLNLHPQASHSLSLRVLVENWPRRLGRRERPSGSRLPGAGLHPVPVGPSLCVSRCLILPFEKGLAEPPAPAAGSVSFSLPPSVPVSAKPLPASGHHRLGCPGHIPMETQSSGFERWEAPWGEAPPQAFLGRRPLRQHGSCRGGLSTKPCAPTKSPSGVLRGA